MPHIVKLTKSIRLLLTQLIDPPPLPTNNIVHHCSVADLSNLLHVCISHKVSRFNFQSESSSDCILSKTLVLSINNCLFSTLFQELCSLDKKKDLTPLAESINSRLKHMVIL